MSDWLDLREYPLPATVQSCRLLVRKDQVLAYGERLDGITWLRTNAECHLVTASVGEIEQKINAPEWEEERKADAEGQAGS